MNNYAILEVDIFEEGVRRAGEISPEHLYFWIASTSEEIVLSLKSFSLKMTYKSEEGGGLLGGPKREVDKQIVELVSDEPEWCKFKIPTSFSSWILWILLKEICSKGWEPYSSLTGDHHFFRKQL